ncbi:MAG: response regulator [Myxococcaceae bacterium]
MTGSILVVEDDADIRDSMLELLADEGLSVTCAVNGLDALNKLRAAAELPKLILLDLMMPEMDGYTFRAEQLKDQRLAKIPVVLMSAGGELEAKAKQLDAQGVMKKPFRDLELIFSTLSKFF